MNGKTTILFFAAGKKATFVLQSFIRSHYFSCYSVYVIIEKTDELLTSFLKKNDIPFHYVSNNLSKLVSNLSEQQEIDYIVSCGWGKKIPSHIIKESKIASLNCHSSCLPDYKGLSVYKAQWANLEPMGGATIHKLSDEFDKGNVICQEKFKICFFDTPYAILTKASVLTSVLLREALLLTHIGYKGTPQLKGRYFLKTSKTKLLLHRAINSLFWMFGSSIRWHTPHK